MSSSDSHSKMKRTPIGYVAADWTHSKVGKVCQIANNLRKPISQEERSKMQGDYPYYGPTGILDYIDEHRVSGKYVLIGEDGDHFLKFREKQMTLLVEGEFNVNNHAHLLKGTKHCCTEWIHLFFQHKPLTPFLTRQGAGRFKLSKGALVDLPISFPPLGEQKKIAKTLCCWDSAIETIQKLIDAKTEQKKGLMHRLFEGIERLDGFNQPWSEEQLGNLFTERVEKGRIDLQLLAITSGAGVVPRDSLDRRDTSNEDKSKYLRVAVGDIGYNTMRMWQGVSGLSQHEGIVSPAYTVVVPSKKVDSLFFSYYFKYPPLVHRFWRYSQGLVNDTLNLKFPSFAKIIVKFPEKDEQEAIAQILTKHDEETDCLRSMLECIQIQKKGLMQQLLTGKTRVSTSDSSSQSSQEEHALNA